MNCSEQIKIRPEVKKELEKLKVHPRQSYSEVIDILIKEHRGEDGRGD